MTTRRRRLVTLVAANVVLLGLVLQIAALDHWRPQIEDVRGVEGSHLHTAHCHGAASSCAEGGGTVYLIGAGPALIPLAPPPRVAFVEDVSVGPTDPAVTELLHPPRAA